MIILTKLSLQIGEKTEAGNRNVAKECLQNPTLLNEIVRRFLKRWLRKIRGIVEEYLDDNRSVVKKAAKALIKAIDRGK
jgi:hypothetical protein